MKKFILIFSLIIIGFVANSQNTFNTIILNRMIGRTDSSIQFIDTIFGKVVMINVIMPYQSDSIFFDANRVRFDSVFADYYGNLNINISWDTLAYYETVDHLTGHYYNITDIDDTLDYYLRSNSDTATNLSISDSAIKFNIGAYWAGPKFKEYQSTALGVWDTEPTFGSGIQNTYIGYNAGYSTTTGYRNTYIGYNAGMATGSGYRNVIVGGLAGYDITSGYDNVYIGMEAGANNTTGAGNSVIGEESFKLNSDGSNNSVLGKFAMANNLHGNGNLMAGYSSGANGTSGGYNTYLGAFSGHKQKGNYNTFIGAYTAYNLDDSTNYRFAIGCRNTGVEADDTTEAPIWGYQGDTRSKSYMYLNAKIYARDTIQVADSLTIMASGYPFIFKDGVFKVGSDGAGSLYTGTVTFQDGGTVTDNAYGSVTITGSTSDTTMFINTSNDSLLLIPGDTGLIKSNGRIIDFDRTVLADSVKSTYFGGRSDFVLGKSGQDMTFGADSLKGQPIFSSDGFKLNDGKIVIDSTDLNQFTKYPLDYGIDVYLVKNNQYSLLAGYANLVYAGPRSTLVSNINTYLADAVNPDYTLATREISYNTGGTENSRDVIRNKYGTTNQLFYGHTLEIRPSSNGTSNLLYRGGAYTVMVQNASSSYVTPNTEGGSTFPILFSVKNNDQYNFTVDYKGRASAKELCLRKKSGDYGFNYNATTSPILWDLSVSDTYDTISYDLQSTATLNYFKEKIHTVGNLCANGIGGIGTYSPLANSFTVKQPNFLVTQENIPAGTDSCEKVTFSSGNPVHTQMATDGDAWNYTINTDDQALFQGASGGYILDNDMSFELRHLYIDFQDSSEVIDVTQNIYSYITNQNNTLFTTIESANITEAGDTITIVTPGDYLITFSFEVENGSVGDRYRIGVFKNNVKVFSVGQKFPSASDSKIITSFYYLNDLVAGDDISLRVTNTVDSDDPTFVTGAVYLRKEHN